MRIVGRLDQPVERFDRLARHDHARHLRRAVRQRGLGLRQPVAVGRDRAQPRLAALAGAVEIDAVEIVPRLLGRDREAGLLDQPLQLLGVDVEGMAEIGRVERRKIGRRQHLELEAGLAAGQDHAPVFGLEFETDLRAVGELAHDIVQHMRRNSRSALRRHLGGKGLDDLDIEIGRGQDEFAAPPLDPHIGQDGDRVAALDDAGDMIERLGERASFDDQTHCVILEPRDRTMRGQPPLTKRGGTLPPPRDASAKLTVKTVECKPRDASAAASLDQSLSSFFRSSTSSRKDGSPCMSCSILRIACSTVVWSRLPKRRPISGRERWVRILARYMPTWRGRTIDRLRRTPSRSLRLTP
jgi:hypothetical protein